MGGAGADGYERSEGAAVIKIIYIILTLVSGILLSGVWFGLNFLIQICVEKSKVKFLERYSVIAASGNPMRKRIIALCVRWCLYGNPAAYDDADI